MGEGAKKVIAKIFAKFWCSEWVPAENVPRSGENGHQKKSCHMARADA